MYVDPDYERIHGLDERKVPCFDPLRRTWVMRTVARFEAGRRPEPHQGDEQLAEERMPGPHNNVTWHREQRKRNIARIVEAFRQHGPMTYEQITEHTGMHHETIRSMIQESDQIEFLGRDDKRPVFGLAGQTMPPSRVAQEIHAHLRERAEFVKVRIIAQHLDKDHKQILRLLKMHEDELFERDGHTWRAI